MSGNIPYEDIPKDAIPLTREHLAKFKEARKLRIERGQDTTDLDELILGMEQAFGDYN